MKSANGMGTNGVQDGQRNVETFVSWASSVKDWKPFITQGLLNVTRISKESGLKRGVFYSNPDLCDVHLPALVKCLEKDGVLKPRVANPAVMQRQSRGGPVSDARMKQIQEESEAVKAENRELKRQLERLKGIDQILHSTGRIPW